MDYFSILPVDITLEILTRVVRTESVLYCKLVCTSWRNLVSHHPSFSKMHLHHLNTAESGKLGFIACTCGSRNLDKFHYFEYNDENHESNPIQRIRRFNATTPLEDSRFVGSCNGLICLANGPSVCICNPITKECVMLPEIQRYGCDVERYRFGACSFGYVSSTNAYKVVGIYRSNANVEVHIYTLGSGKGWRNLGNFSTDEFKIYYWDQAGVFANGTLYWLDDEFEMIVTFDLTAEKFGEHLSPLFLPPESDGLYRAIGVLDGFLYFANCLYVDGKEVRDISLLRKKNDNHDKKERDNRQSLGWNKEFRVADRYLLAITKSDSVLTYNILYLSIYDTKALTSKRLVEFKNGLFHVSPHKNTFVSLKELGEEETKSMESVKIVETKDHDYPLKQSQKDADLR